MKGKQKTLKNSGKFSGVTLHTGVRAQISIEPAPIDSGIEMLRVDLPGSPRIKALAKNVVSVQRATTIASGNASVHTVEHVLAALYACGVDNAVIKMDGPEPPIGDGSSAPYVSLILKAGTKVQDAPRHVFTLKEPVYVNSGNSKLIMLPAEDYTINCTVKYDNGSMDTQFLKIPVNRKTFIDEISPARTFCLYEEIEELMVKNLIRGGSLDNAVVMKDGFIICKDGLRFQDEFVRHKILDIIGDLSLVGCRIVGEVIAIKPGHPSNVALAGKLIEKIGHDIH